ncbi:MAG: efflux RND transporter periplasmic adaptor subunit [Planctomycetes bacterium]|nr:efflux RND transporter periplasmic adaptor subunit [Planctomycetota bacterium]
MRTEPLLAALVALAACRHEPTGSHPPPQPVPVATVTVTQRNLPTTFRYLGITAASRHVEIRARVAGFLERRQFVEGSMVDAGDLLFSIDRRPLLAQREAAAAEVAVAEAQVEQTDREAARLEPLVAQDAVTEKERDDAVSAARIAQASLAAARARLTQIEVDLGYTEVRAPIAGRIGRELRPQGSLVDPTSENGLLTTLLQLDPIHVDFQRSDNQQFRIDRDLASGRIALPAGGKLEVSLQDRHGHVLASGGAIDFTAGRLDERTGSIPMRATLANPGGKLLAGQAVRVVLSGAYLDDAIAIPQRCVLESPQGKLVMVVDQDEAGHTIAQPRSVHVGEWVDVENGDTTERAWVVLDGLAAGDRVILDNLVKLRPGAPIVVDEDRKD